MQTKISVTLEDKLSSIEYHLSFLSYRWVHTAVWLSRVSLESITKILTLDTPSSSRYGWAMGCLFVTFKCLCYISSIRRNSKSNIVPRNNMNVEGCLSSKIFDICYSCSLLKLYAVLLLCNLYIGCQMKSTLIIQKHWYIIYHLATALSGCIWFMVCLIIH